MFQFNISCRRNDVPITSCYLLFLYKWCLTMHEYMIISEFFSSDRALQANIFVLDVCNSNPTSVQFFVNCSFSHLFSVCQNDLLLQIAGIHCYIQVSLWLLQMLVVVSTSSPAHFHATSSSQIPEKRAQKRMGISGLPSTERIARLQKMFQEVWMTNMNKLCGRGCSDGHDRTDSGKFKRSAI